MIKTLLITWSLTTPLAVQEHTTPEACSAALVEMELDAFRAGYDIQLTCELVVEDTE